jgi:hypothetical protein
VADLTNPKQHRRQRRRSSKYGNHKERSAHTAEGRAERQLRLRQQRERRDRHAVDDDDREP